MTKIRYAGLVLLILVVAYWTSGCGASWGIARLPENSTLFVSQSKEDAFVMAGEIKYPYQPIGYVEVNKMIFKPCGGGSLRESYSALEEVLSKDLFDKAKNQMGADAIIAVDWIVQPGPITMVNVKGLAVKKNSK